MKTIFLLLIGLSACLCFSQEIPQAGTLAPLDSLEGIVYSRGGGPWRTQVQLAVDAERGQVLELAREINPEVKYNSYCSFSINFPQPLNLEDVAVAIDARSELPKDTGAFYVRFYNRGSKKPSWSFSSWNNLLTDKWTTFTFQKGLSLVGLSFEKHVVDGRPLDQADRIEVIIGGHAPSRKMSARFTNLRTVTPVKRVSDSGSYPPRAVGTDLVKDGRAAAVILHPDSEAGRSAAARIVATVKAATGVALAARPGKLDDYAPQTNAVMLGSMVSNPAMRVLYARKFTVADGCFPGADNGYFLHVAQNPHGGNRNIVFVEASDDGGLTAAAEAFAAHLARLPKGRSLTLPALHELKVSDSIHQRFARMLAPGKASYVQDGLAAGRRNLAQGKHCSIAGQLAELGTQYLLSNDPQVARLFVELWKIYAAHAETAQDVFGRWGFDSDFPSISVWASWDLIEEEPSLTDEDRLLVVRHMLKWMSDSVLPKCAGGVAGRVTHNHGTFPSMGCARAAIWLEANFPNSLEERIFREKADKVFREQALHPKPMEDCNGYQWLTLGHTMQYALMKPDYTIFTSGTARKIADYCLQNMDNLTIQVPYGDTGSWLCWDSEQVCLDMIALATGYPNALWAAQAKRAYRKQQPGLGQYAGPPQAGLAVPTDYNGLMAWPLLKTFYDTFKPADGEWIPACKNGVDKVTFREKLDPEALYLLLDGISTGTHKHEDGNSIPRLTQFNRIWLADNDYFKAPLKYHNSIAVLANGESGKVKPFVQLDATGEDDAMAFTVTSFRDYVKTDWRRAVVWLKRKQAVLVLDALTAREDADYQFKMNWHGIGEAAFDADGLLLKQRGPSMRIQVARGPQLSLNDDQELGTNWNNYPYADAVVHSLSAIDSVRLAAGETAMFATVLHGRPDGEEPAWRLAVLAGQNGVVFDDGNGPVAVALDKLLLGGGSRQLAGALNYAEGTRLRKAWPWRPGVPPVAVKATADSRGEVPDWLRNKGDYALACRPVRAVVKGKSALPHHERLWSFASQTNQRYLSPNKGRIQSEPDFCQVKVQPAKLGRNVLIGGRNTNDNLFDGDLRSAGAYVMYPVDATVVIDLTFKREATVEAVRWLMWHASTSSKHTSYLLQKAIIGTTADGTFMDLATCAEYIEERNLPDWGDPVPCAVKVNRPCKGLRVTLVPKPGAAIYMAELAVIGEARKADDHDVFDRITAVAGGRLASGKTFIAAGTDVGELTVLDDSGRKLAAVELPSCVNAVTCADVDKDGGDEIAVGLNSGQVLLLKSDLTKLWEYQLDRYRVAPAANLILTGELDGDGYPEVIVGANNWRFYAFDRNGKFLWHYESVHPSRSGAIADLDGDGLDEVVCGTHYYSMTVLNGKGKRNWRANFGPICWSLATGRFSQGKTRGIIAGSGNGFAYMFDSTGKQLMSFNTGEEVHSVITADLDAGLPSADGLDEALAASYSHFIYAWNGDGSRRWQKDLTAPVLAIARTSEGGRTFVHAALQDGRLLTLDGLGNTIRATALGAVPTILSAVDGKLLVVAADGRLSLFK